MTALATNKRRSAPVLLLVLTTLLSTALPVGAQTADQPDASPTTISSGPSLPAIPNPLDAIAAAPDRFAKLVQDTGTFLLRQMVGGLNDLLRGLTQGEDNVITHTPPAMTYRQPLVTDAHQKLVVLVDVGLAAALAVTGLLVILGPNSPLSYPTVGEIVPRVVIAIIAAHSSLSWGGWFVDLNNALCDLVTPSDPFPLASGNEAAQAFALLGLALLYGFMALFLSLFMFARVQLIAVLLIVAPLAVVLWVLPGRPRQWAELWLDLFFSNLFVQFLQVLTLHFGVALLQTAIGDSAGFMQFLGGAASLLLVFRMPALVAAGVGGGATSFLGMATFFRAVHHLGVARLSSQMQAGVSQVPGASWSSIRHPRASVAQEWRSLKDDLAHAPASVVAGAAWNGAGAAAGRVRDEVAVRRGV
jgi:hypothetical protein